MTRYDVKFTPTARRHAVAAAEYIAAAAPANAARWYAGLEKAVLSLDTFPGRCPRAPESDFLGEELRHYLYHSHRVIFRVDEAARVVWVLYVRHGARRAAGDPEGESPDE